jgi:formylglycine-generating enzyme required for sulfatase activity
MSKKVHLPPIPEGIESKVVTARDGSPLIELVKIPAGKFLMGSSDLDSLAYGNEKPQREVNLDSYWIARTPVTNRMWKKYIKESGYQPVKTDRDEDYLDHWSGNRPPAGKLDHPVVYVSYMAAMAFCEFYGLILPSEAQWEKAARGVDGRKYPWGDQEPTADLCNFNDNVGDTTPVGSYKKGISPFGLLNCAGNVWEWCAGEHENLALRGGSFFDYHLYVRCAYRSRYNLATFCYCYIGFRPAQGTIGDKNE